MSINNCRPNSSTILELTSNSVVLRRKGDQYIVERRLVHVKVNVVGKSPWNVNFHSFNDVVGCTLLQKVLVELLI